MCTTIRHWVPNRIILIETWEFPSFGDPYLVFQDLILCHNFRTSLSQRRGSYRSVPREVFGWHAVAYSAAKPALLPGGRVKCFSDHFEDNTWWWFGHQTWGGCLRKLNIFGDVGEGLGVHCQVRKNGVHLFGMSGSHSTSSQTAVYPTINFKL